MKPLRRVAAWITRHRATRRLAGALRRHWPVIVAAVSVIALLAAVNPPRLLGVLSHVQWRIALLMIPVTLGTYVCRGLAWWVTLRRIGVQIGVLRTLTIELAGQVMVFLPLGDLARVAMVHKVKPRTGVGRIAGTITFQELVFMTLLGWGVLPRVVSQHDVGVLVLLMTLFHLGIFLLLAWEPAYRWARRTVEKIRPLRRFDKPLRALRPAFIAIFDWRTVIPVLALQAMAAALSFLLFYLALQAIGVTHVTYITSTFVLGFSYVIAGLSFAPAGVGVFEGLLTILMVTNGVPAAAGAAAGLLYRGYNDIFMALVGAPFAIAIRRAGRSRRPARRRVAQRSHA
jgi:uncharacterized membrane protein YbhN (UPF0104 family)